MRIPIYPFIEGNVRVWKGYYPYKEGLKYCFASEDRGIYMFCTDINHLVDVLRDYRVYPYQIENHSDLIGIRKELSDEQFQRVIKGVSRPKIFAAKLQRFNGEVTRPAEEAWEDIDLNRRFSLNIDRASGTEIYPLINLIKKLNWCGAKDGDLKLREATEFGYINLDDRYKYYILSSLDRVK